MRGFVDELQSLEGRGGILSVSLAHSFPWGDVEPCTAQVLVVADGDSDKAERLAERLGRKFVAMRRQLDLNALSLDKALDKALANERGPVVVADQADNAGGGAPGDSTFVLKALLERGVQDAAIALFWDPVAVQLAISAGLGARLDLRLGGKIGPASGNPLDLAVTVTGIARALIQEWPQQSGEAIRISCGDTVALHCQGSDIIVSSKRTQVFGLEVFTEFGIDPRQRRLLVVKSMQHFYAAYAPIASEVIYMAAPGAVAPLFKEIPYQRVALNKYPWVDDPLVNPE
jgi:microcystin degradation protein MlrC